jgi:beta-glucosidase
MGLFDGEGTGAPSPSGVGSPEHRAVAREAAAASAVLLEHRQGTLPLAGDRVLVAGPGADDIGLQCGGWTIEWQGGTGPITPGTTILEGLRRNRPDISFLHEAGGEFDERAAARTGIVVVAEAPYAEGIGDRADLRLPAEQAAIIDRVRRRVDRLVLVVISGRPILLGEVADRCDAIVAAWLPGTEGDGVADVLTGRRPFTGRLPRPWPADTSQVEDPAAGGTPAWPRGHGRAL